MGAVLPGRSIAVVLLAFGPADAVIVAFPLPAAVTTPASSTFATEFALVVQVTVTPVTAVEFWSRTSTLSFAVAPSAVSTTVAGVIATDVGRAGSGVAVAVGSGLGATVATGGVAAAFGTVVSSLLPATVREWLPKDHLAALADLFHQVLELCRQAGLMKLGHVALDSTKVRANASKHTAMSNGRIKEREAQLKAEVDELLRQAGEVDEEEDRRYSRDERGDELPEELSVREGRLRRIREAKAALEAEAHAAAEQVEAEDREHPGVPDDRVQRNLTDPDSRIMPGPGGRDFQQSYNCQAVVDHEHQVIVAARGRMRRKLRTKRGRERYALRMETAEPVFGQIKQGRGFRQFLLWGLEKVNRE